MGGRRNAQLPAQRASKAWAPRGGNSRSPRVRAPLATATAPGQSAGQANRYAGPVISVFTPSHDPRWLDEALYSVLGQTHQDWEWIVLLNGDADWAPPADERVHVQRSTLENIG